MEPPTDLGLIQIFLKGLTFHGVDVSDGIAYVDISFDYEIPPTMMMR